MLRREALLPTERNRGLGTVAVVCTMAGVASGLAGDRWSLGFLAETEAQVERHLDGHLDRLPADDRRSREIVTQMRDDENRHGAMGRAMGGAELPLPVKLAMRGVSKVMTRTAYWV